MIHDHGRQKKSLQQGVAGCLARSTPKWFFWAVVKIKGKKKPGRRPLQGWQHHRVSFLFNFAQQICLKNTNSPDRSSRLGLRHGAVIEAPGNDSHIRLGCQTSGNNVSTYRQSVSRLPPLPPRTFSLTKCALVDTHIHTQTPFSKRYLSSWP